MSAQMVEVLDIDLARAILERLAMLTVEAMFAEMVWVKSVHDYVCVFRKRCSKDDDFIEFRESTKEHVYSGSLEHVD